MRGRSGALIGNHVRPGVQHVIKILLLNTQPPEGGEPGSATSESIDIQTDRLTQKCRSQGEFVAKYRAKHRILS